MNTHSRRYVFVDYENLRKIKFRKLEKVCQKIYVFIRKSEKNISFNLVQQTQKLGNNLKWVIVDNPTGESMAYHMCFIMGKLHQKINQDIEFAILSNDKSFDSIINFINKSDRSCIRVKRKKNRRKEVVKENGLVNSAKVTKVEEKVFEPSYEVTFEHQTRDLPKFAQPSTSIIHDQYDDKFIEKSATETKKRLLHSGNRPAELTTLREYIRLYNQELISVNGSIDMIIDRMKETNDIEVSNQEVRYHF